MFARLLLVLMLVVANSHLSFADILISNYSNATNDRFTNSSSFILNGFNLSGVGRTFDGRWATLIDRDIVVSANHFAPLSDVYFYSNNNPATAPVIRQIAASTQIGTSDLWIGKLASAVDASISHFSYATDVLTGPAQSNPNTLNSVNAGQYQNDLVNVVGVSPATGQLNQQDQAYGQNRISGFAKSYAFSGGLTDVLVMTTSAVGQGDYINYEATLVVGDSGAPLFAATGPNTLTLLGVNSFVLGNANGPLFNGATYLGNYVPEIQDFTATAVPEPTSIAMLFAAAAASISRFRKRRSIAIA